MKDSLNDERRRRNAIGLDVIMQKGRRYDGTKSKNQKYYKKAQILRNYHRMLKREGVDEPAVEQKQEKVEEEAADGNSSDEEDVPMKEAVAEKEPAAKPELYSERMKRTTICKFLLSDKGCKNGMQCKYLHDRENAPNKGKHKLRVCRFFQSRGGCSNGDRCKFMHSQPDGTTENSSKATSNGAASVRAKAEETPKSSMISTWEKKRQEDILAREEKERQIEAARVKREENKKRRSEKTRLMRVRTKKGQPLMKNAISSILSQIESSTSSSN